MCPVQSSNPSPMTPLAPAPTPHVGHRISSPSRSGRTRSTAAALATAARRPATTTPTGPSSLVRGADLRHPTPGGRRRGRAARRVSSRSALPPSGAHRTCRPSAERSRRGPAVAPQRRALRATPHVGHRIAPHIALSADGPAPPPPRSPPPLAAQRHPTPTGPSSLVRGADLRHPTPGGRRRGRAARRVSSRSALPPSGAHRTCRPSAERSRRGPAVAPQRRALRATPHVGHRISSPHRARTDPLHRQLARRHDLAGVTDQFASR